MNNIKAVPHTLRIYFKCSRTSAKIYLFLCFSQPMRKISLILIFCFGTNNYTIANTTHDYSHFSKENDK